jgi:hypothetical protein
MENTVSDDGERIVGKNRRELRQYVMYLLTAIGQPHGDRRTVHIYTQTIHRTTQITNEQHK